MKSDDAKKNDRYVAKRICELFCNVFFSDQPTFAVANIHKKKELGHLHNKEKKAQLSKNFK